MLFSTSIPDRLSEYPTVTSFMSVLDGLQEYKKGIISDAIRANNPALFMDKKWLLKMLEEFGITDIPYDYPIQILQQVVLNAEILCATKGSKIGLELYCSLLSFGEVTIDDSNFFAYPKIVILDSLKQGFLIEDDPDLENPLCLVNDSSLINPEVVIKITIKSRFFSESEEYSKESTAIKDYISNSIYKQLGFANANVELNFESTSEFYFHKLLNRYFV